MRKPQLNNWQAIVFILIWIIGSTKWILTAYSLDQYMRWQDYGWALILGLAFSLPLIFIARKISRE